MSFTTQGTIRLHGFCLLPMIHPQDGERQGTTRTSVPSNVHHCALYKYSILRASYVATGASCVTFHPHLARTQPCSLPSLTIAAHPASTSSACSRNTAAQRTLEQDDPQKTALATQTKANKSWSETENPSENLRKTVRDKRESSQQRGNHARKSMPRPKKGGTKTRRDSKRAKWHGPALSGYKWEATQLLPYINLLLALSNHDVKHLSRLSTLKIHLAPTLSAPNITLLVLRVMAHPTQPRPWHSYSAT